MAEYTAKEVFENLGIDTKSGYAVALELLRDIVTASDHNDGETLLNCIANAREFLDWQEPQ